MSGTHLAQPRQPSAASANPREETDVELQSLVQRTPTGDFSIETSLSDNLSKCHPQDQSVLYSTLPKELRDLIFAFATAPFEDMENGYDVNERYYRPGYRAPRKTSTTLLLTCRRIWLETSALPMRQAVHSFWYSMGPPGRSYICHTGLTALNWQNLTTVQLFLQLCNAEHMLENDGKLAKFMCGLRPKTLKITIRHSDWWDWETHNALELRNDRWVESMLNQANTVGIERVQLELETLESAKGQLIPIVDKVKQLESCTRVVYSESLSVDSSGRNAVAVCLKPSNISDVWHWTGSSGLKGNGLTYGEKFTLPHKNLTRLDYHVEIITWNAVRTSVDAPLEAEPRQSGLTSPAFTPASFESNERHPPEIPQSLPRRRFLRRLIRRPNPAI